MALSKEELIQSVAGRLAAEGGTPCYVYDAAAIRERVATVRRAFGERFRISYAVKSNPNAALLRRMHGLVPHLDVSSGGEVLHALSCGWEAACLSFTGPGKTPAELELAVRNGLGEVIVESVEEAAALDQLAARHGRRPAVLVRISPMRVPRGFGASMSGRASQFGIDEEDADPALRAIQALPHLELAGLHIYSGTQCLQANAIAENFEIFASIFRRLADTHGLNPRTLVFGSGLGIPYHEGDAELDLPAVAARVNPLLDALRAEPRFAATQFLLETGRYLVGEAGFYVTRVVRVKRSRKTSIGICDGGMNHHLAAAGLLGSVVPRNYRMFKLPPMPEAVEQPFTLVGPLCTSIDMIGRQVKLRGLAAGDLIVIQSSGAYGLTASPMHFIRHAPAGELLVDEVDGVVQVYDCTQFRAAAPGGDG